MAGATPVFDPAELNLDPAQLGVDGQQLMLLGDLTTAFQDFDAAAQLAFGTTPVSDLSGVLAW